MQEGGLGSVWQRADLRRADSGFPRASHSMFYGPQDCAYLVRSFWSNLFMSDRSSTGSPDSAAVLESMTLLATLSTAASVRESVAERRAGRDPSAQAPPARAAARLHTVGHTLMDLLMQVAQSRVPLVHQEDPPLPRAVRHFDVLLKLRRAEQCAQNMHQHLLSLYPNVSEALVEETRRTRDAMARYIEQASEAARGPGLTEVLEQGIGVVVWARHEVPVGGPPGASSTDG